MISLSVKPVAHYTLPHPKFSLRRIRNFFALPSLAPFDFKRFGEDVFYAVDPVVNSSYLFGNVRVVPAPANGSKAGPFLMQLKTGRGLKNIELEIVIGDRFT